jgi:hypothetical protein
MKGAIFVLILVTLAIRSEARDLRVPIGSASLVVQATENRPAGAFTLTLSEPARIFTSPEGDLTPVTGFWLSISFTSDSGDVFTLHHDTLQMWPYAEGIRALHRGDVIVTSFAVRPGGYFYLATKSGERLQVLPAGRYKVTGCLTVPVDKITRRLRLTRMKIRASPVVLIVPPS